MVQGGEGGIEGSGHHPDAVVVFGVRGIQRQRNGLDADLLHPEDLLFGEQRRHRRRQRDSDTAGRGGRHQFGEIGPLERIAAGHHQVRQRLAVGAEAEDVVQDGDGLLGGQLAGGRLRHCSGPAVTAGQTAGVGQLPVDDHGRSVVGPICIGAYRTDAGGVSGGHVRGLLVVPRRKRVDELDDRR